MTLPNYHIFNNKILKATIVLGIALALMVLSIAMSNSNKPQPISSFAGVPGAAGCGMTLNISTQKDTIAPGEQASYSLTIKNEGQLTCNSASVSVYYSDNESFVSSNPKGSANSNYYWKLGNMTPGSEKTISITTIHKKTDTAPVIKTEACATANNGTDACATLAVNVGVSTTQAEPAPTEPVADFDPGTKEYGTWVWTSPYAMSSAYMSKVISAADENDINVIYVTVDDYLTINALAEGATKEAKKAKYNDALEKFIIAANQKGIAVDVEAGWRDWAEAANINKSNVIIDFAIAYNASHTDKIRGVQFDIEPYLMPTYEKNKAVLLKNFVTLVDASTKRMGASDMRLSFVIPHFYDSAQKWTPAITYGGFTTYTFDHMLRILDTRANSSIILMSYRNFANGSDGSIQISKTEIEAASNGAHPTKVIVAQETGDVEPAYVTFHDTSRAEYEKQVALINQAFSAKSGFGGISVHYIDPFLELQ